MRLLCRDAPPLAPELLALLAAGEDGSGSGMDRAAEALQLFSFGGTFFPKVPTTTTTTTTYSSSSTVTSGARGGASLGANPTSKAAKAVSAAAAASTNLHTLSASKEDTILDLKARIVAAVNAAASSAAALGGGAACSPRAPLTLELTHLRCRGRVLRVEEDSLSAADICDGAEVALAHGPPLAPHATVFHVCLRGLQQHQQHQQHQQQHSFSLVLPLTARTGSLRKAILARICSAAAEGGLTEQVLASQVPTQHHLRLRAAPSPALPPAAAQGHFFPILRDEAVLRGVFGGGSGTSGAPSTTAAAAASSSSSSAGVDERWVSAEILAAPEHIRAGDGVLRLRHLALPGDGTPIGSILGDMAGSLGGLAGGGSGHGGALGAAALVDEACSAQLGPPLDFVVPWEQCDTFSELGLLVATACAAQGQFPPQEDQAHLLGALFLAIAPAFGPALTCWEAKERLAWLPAAAGTGIPLERVADGSTIVWKLERGGSAAAAAAAPAGRGASAVATLRGGKENTGGGAAKPWLAAKRAAKSGGVGGGAPGPEDCVVLERKR